MQDEAIIQFVDVWKTPELAWGLPVSLIPTQKIIDSSGKPYVPNEDLDSVLKFVMYYDQSTNEGILTRHHGGLDDQQMR